jgi:hypothetical protein
MAEGSKGTGDKDGGAGSDEHKKPSFGPDRKGESSAGAVASKDKKRSVASSRDDSNTR